MSARENNFDECSHEMKGARTQRKQDDLSYFSILHERPNFDIGWIECSQYLNASVHNRAGNYEICT